MYKNLFLAGKAGTGKTKLCEYLQEKYRYSQAKIANGVYMICEKYLGMKEKERPKLQTVGSDIARKKISQNIWIDRFLEDTWIAKQFDPSLIFVCDDARFKNESDRLLDEGWIGIYLDSPEEIRIQRLTTRDGNAHIDRLNHFSETSVDEFKDELIKVDTSGSLEQSYENLEATLEYIRKEQLH